MKNICVLLLVFLGGRMLAGCSDDGVYTPIEVDEDAGVPEVACVEKAGCDGGADAE